MPQEPERESRMVVCPPEMFDDPKCLLTFTWMLEYTQSFEELELTDEGQRAIETVIMLDPVLPPVMEGTGGVRAFEISTPTLGPGSLQLTVFYAYFPEVGKVALMDLAQTDDIGPMTAVERAKLKEIYQGIQEIGPEAWES